MRVLRRAVAGIRPLLTRDRILMVEGGLREDEFSGGFALRAKRCWDFTQLCGQQAQRLSIRLDLRAPGALHQFEHVLKAHAGTTPVLIEATTASGVGRLSINGGRGLRMDAALPGLLRSLPACTRSTCTWANPGRSPSG